MVHKESIEVVPSPQKKTESDAGKERVPDPARRRVQTIVQGDPLTRQSFKEECDINNIVETYRRTGVVPSSAGAAPQYGDAPDISLFEAACVQAEIASAATEGAFDPDPEPDNPETPETPPEASEAVKDAPKDAPEDAAPDESSG